MLTVNFVYECRCGNRCMFRLVPVQVVCNVCGHRQRFCHGAPVGQDGQPDEPTVVDGGKGVTCGDARPSDPG